MPMMINIFVFAVIGLAQAAHAGGDYETAVITQFDVHGSTYTLVVTPKEVTEVDDSYIPPLRHCKTFTIIGKFEDKHWKRQRKKGPTRKSHMMALASIKAAWEFKKPINLGYMGSSGFTTINGKDPCMVGSNGLEVMGGAVLSYGDGI